MNKTIPILFSTILLLLVVPATVESYAGLFSTTDFGVMCSVHSNQISYVNVTSVISSVTVNLGTGYTDGTPFSTAIGSCKGLAQDPTTGLWWGLFAEGGGSNTPALGQFDPFTGVGTLFPVSFPKANNMAITSSGDIYISYGADSGISGDLALLDKTTGEVVSSCTTSGNRGSLGWNWDSDTMWLMTTASYPVMDIQEINPTTCADIGSPLTTTAPANGQGAPHAFTYNTVDGLFYMTQQNSPYSVNATTGIATLVGGGVGGNIRGWAFELVLPDIVAPIISTTESELITILQDSSYNEFTSVNCIDDTDGLITNTMITVGTVDTSIRGLQTVEYTCTDEALNESTEIVTYIVKKKSSSGSGGTSSGTQLSDIPTLSFQDSPSQQTPTPDRTGQSISDLLTNLFSNRIDVSSGDTIVESVPTSSIFNTPQSGGSPTTSDRNFPIADFFSNLFSNIFG